MISNLAGVIPTKALKHINGIGKHRIRMLLIIVMIMIGLSLHSVDSMAGTIPTTSILTVVADKSVTLRTYNFPANQDFSVRMGAFGTKGVNGTLVDATNSGAGGTFDVTYNIPDNLKGSDRIAIRLESPQGYYAYDWFYNTDGGSASSSSSSSPSGGGAVSYSGYPTTTITGVAKDTTVTLTVYNLPVNQTFTVRMGAWGTKGVNGTVVDTLDSGSGGSMSVTFNIPANLHTYSKIAIRLESPQGYYAYDWFYNSDGNVAISSSSSSPSGGGSSYAGIPSTTITSVVKDATVSLTTSNFPANQTFTVRMGAIGTRGENGTVVDTVSSGSGGSLNFTFNIPADLHGSSQISIRLESPQGYYAYDWFNNQ